MKACQSAVFQASLGVPPSAAQQQGCNFLSFYRSMHFEAQQLLTCLLAALDCLQNKEKVNNLVLFDKPVYDKMIAEVPKYKMITQVRVQRAAS